VANSFPLDNTVENFAVFGNPVKHSRSPSIHNLFAKQFAIQLHYDAIDVQPEQFEKTVKAFAVAGGKGLNITVPHKELAFKLCDILTPLAKTCHSVNTIWFDDELNIYGDTTDGEGLVRDLQNNHEIKLVNKRILILGAGGTVPPVLLSLLQQKPESITIVNRTLAKAEVLVERYKGYGTLMACGYDQLEQQYFEIIINATSASLQGDVPPLSADIVRHSECCYDLMYSKEATPFLKWADNNGSSLCIDGLGMLVEQAACGFNIWHGKMPETSSVISAIKANNSL